ncbi:MAG TPA: DUF4331 domain-containing protein, partial [Verrucomicrobiota bacterium]|nr:DUF4331 domain-containing protein [Verrucomicrobiota bacterium]
MNTKQVFPLLVSGLVGLLSAGASSHREAPLITTTPKLDCTDFYSFGSYEPGREGYVTLIANYVPLQDAYGGPNYFQLDPAGLYEIHVDNNGDALEDLTFQFRFSNVSRDIALVIGTGDNKRTNAIPLLAAGQVTAGNNGALNVDQTYTLTLVKGPRRGGDVTPILNPKDNTPNFTKPQDNVGNKTFPEYDAYADQYIYEIALPGTDKKGKVFVGQRKDPFVVNLGETFDLVNLNPLGPVDGAKDTLADKNVTALCLEVPKEFLLAGGNSTIIGSWTTASTVRNLGNVGQEIAQVSRLSMPLVNEVVIGLKDKNKFNASEPKDDGQFVDYITHPTLPALLELLFNVPAPTLFPRTDLVAAFATGVEGLNKNGSVAEMQRLNTAVPATPREGQNNLGVIAGITKGVLDTNKADLAGFPNGRRPGDDVVDIALRVVMGKLLTPDVAPIDDAPLTDGALVNASFFSNKFPYLTTPLAGSPNDLSITIQPQASPSLTAPFKAVPGTFDSATRRLTVTAPGDGSSSFLGIKSDAKASLDAP